MWTSVLQVAQGKAAGTISQSALVFFVGLASIILGGSRAKQAIRLSAEAGGVGRHFTKRNFGFALVILWLPLWYVAYERYLAYQALIDISPQPARDAMVQTAVLVIGGLLSAGMGYELINPVAWVADWRYKKSAIRTETLSELRSLSPSQFEVAVAQLLRDLDYRNVSVVGGAGDLARDIRCKDPEGKSVSVQCKKYGEGHSVSSPDVQRFIGMLITEHHAKRGIIVTTTELTEHARNLCRNHEVEVWDSEKLPDLLNQAKRRQRPNEKPIATALLMSPRQTTLNVTETKKVSLEKQFCLECGTQLPVGSKFCTKCGTKQA